MRAREVTSPDGVVRGYAMGILRTLRAASRRDRMTGMSSPRPCHSEPGQAGRRILMMNRSQEPMRAREVSSPDGVVRGHAMGILRSLRAASRRDRMTSLSSPRLCHSEPGLAGRRILMMNRSQEPMRAREVSSPDAVVRGYAMGILRSLHAAHPAGTE